MFNFAVLPGILNNVINYTDNKDLDYNYEADLILAKRIGDFETVKVRNFWSLEEGRQVIIIGGLYIDSDPEGNPMPVVNVDTMGDRDQGFIIGGGQFVLDRDVHGRNGKDYRSVSISCRTPKKTSKEEYPDDFLLGSLIPVTQGKQFKLKEDVLYIAGSLEMNRGKLKGENTIFIQTGVGPKVWYIPIPKKFKSNTEENKPVHKSPNQEIEDAWVNLDSVQVDLDNLDL